MCSDFAIQVKNLSKCYQIYDRPSDRLKQSIYTGLRRLVGQNAKPLFREFWALRDITFDIVKGESVGIIGQNGSGKSTLLQLICGTLNATSGTVKTNGRVAALLELGSGFNPEFTGRENVYMNGAVLGLSEAEINDRFDEILSFADIGEFIDQPTKTYSSGMLVRLAFAVQVCIEPDILIVDEALAVGDALFQKRCFERMDRLRTNGTTLLFVSHDQESVRTMTNKAIFLEHGVVKFSGTSADALLEYRKSLHEVESKRLSQVAEHLKEKARQARVATQEKIQQAAEEEKLEPSIVQDNTATSASEDSTTPAFSERLKAYSFGDLDAEVLDVSLFNADGEPASNFDPRDKVTVIVRCKTHAALNHLNVGLRIRNKEGVKMYSWGTLNQDMAILSGAAEPGDVFWQREFAQGSEFSVKFEFICGMGPNLYEIQVSITEEGKPYYAEQRMIHWIDEAAFFTVNTQPQSYHFGGVADLRMVSGLL
ncbi:TPA: ATP-binding cassette domain-containing protein [Kluyvera intermedia]|uniref:Sugar ABC transporter ATP-binding protein n=2 Tax=Enterobacteriaceae TaxID=543 RepID=A0AAC8QM12_9ENTR|nr:MULTISPECIES: ABC transporter ATP-binding protein [Enterobacteriaceae]HAT2203491.1 ATP-binding cassette domain-containing protein [Kluyvera intermedia]AKL11246.1 sugar ABC transporter ATP-binding protein [Phytobacter ursingii]MCL9670148.1 ABC transporter ATP-binding protein [Citrobacter sp. MNAZ 1397]HAT2514204.1 ATP-binding cassette domain-containing protein [Kluyvera intermedia]HAT2602922.1 ATP-binding cassette domain-containing protein [Kluyvera intermedia]